MQHLKEFLIRIQTFDLRVFEDDIQLEWGTNEKKHVKAYDLTYETQYYDSFSYRSELRVLKDMAFLDLLILNKDLILLQLAELSKVRNRFKEFWTNYNQHYSEMNLVYHRSFIISIRLEYLFIVNNLQSDSADIEVTAKFAEDLGDSVKLREKFLMELIYATENFIKPKITEVDFKKRMNAQLPGQESAKVEEVPAEIENTNEAKEVNQPPIVVQETTYQPELSGEQAAIAKIVGYYPTFKQGAAVQLFDLLKDYFLLEDHVALEKLLLYDEAPAAPLVFRGFATQLADAFKQLYDANLIVGCRKSDLEKWIAPKFMYLSQQSEPRELPEGYLSGLMSENTRPCKSPILKIEQKVTQFFILPTPRNKR